MALLQVQKRIIALSGLVMTAFLIVHVLANLSLFSTDKAQQVFSWYQQGWIRWPVIFLFVSALLIHIRIAITIRLKNARARQISYYKQDKLHIPASLISVSIFLLFVFIIFHLYQTFSFSDAPLQSQIMTWFSSPWLVLIYMAGVTILSMHLLHALTGVLQTLGITSKQFVISVATGIGLLFIGFSCVPLLFFWSQL